MVRCRWVRQRVLWAAGGAGLAIGLFLLANRQEALRVDLLDVGGYADSASGWMPLRVTLGLTNGGRDLVTVRRIVVEPDFEGFNEAFNTGATELVPALLIEPGGQASYQTRGALLNAPDLPIGRHTLRLRVRLESNGTEQTVVFPGEFVHAADPARRTFHPGPR